MDVWARVVLANRPKTIAETRMVGDTEDGLLYCGYMKVLGSS